MTAGFTDDDYGIYRRERRDRTEDAEENHVICFDLRNCGVVMFRI
jgi:hypothetical protein